MVFKWHPDAPLSLKAVFVVGFVLGTATFITSVWCLVVVLSAKKLRKPLWLFRASLCAKDIILCLIALLPNLLSWPTQGGNEVSHYYLYFNTVVIGCISASIFTLLCGSVDRYHAATRPFRYHVGELMPVSISLTLLFNCWMMGIITAICVVWDYSEPARHSYGILLQFVSLEIWQKGILLAGLSVVHFISGSLLAVSLSRVSRQKRESRIRLENGQEEPIRSRRNSVSEETPSTSRPQRSDRESEADQMFLQIEEPGVNQKKTTRKWSLTSTRKIAFFTPRTYRPSILRRIRDTWYLYAVVITWTIFFFTTISPFYYLIIAGEYCTNNWNSPGEHYNGTTQVITTLGSENGSVGSNGNCIITAICDCLLLSQGFICVLTYIFVDDIFRPKFLRPVAFILLPCQRFRRRGSGSIYSANRKRTLSRNSNVMSFSL